MGLPLGTSRAMYAWLEGFSAAGERNAGELQVGDVGLGW